MIVRYIKSSICVNLSNKLIYVCGAGVLMNLVIYMRAVEAGITWEHTFADIYLWSIGNPVNLCYIHTPVFLLLLSACLKHDDKNPYFILKARSKAVLCLANFGMIIFFTAVWSAENAAAALLMSLNPDIFNFSGSQFLLLAFKDLQQISSHDAGAMLIGVSCNAAGYFLCIGALYYLLYMILRNKSAVLSSIFVLICIDYIFYLNKADIVPKFSFFGHVFLNYSENNMNRQFNGFYWLGSLVLLLCLGLLLSKNMQISRNKLKFTVLRQNMRYLKYYQKYYLPCFLGVGLIYTFLAGMNIGYSKNGLLYTLDLYFSGSSGLDIRLILWIFLELCVTAAAVNFVYQFRKYNRYTKMILFKNRKAYMKFINGILVTVAAVFTVSVFIISGLYLSVAGNNLFLNDYLFLKVPLNSFIQIINLILNFTVFSFLVLGIDFYVGNIVKSYFIVFIYQMFAFAAVSFRPGLELIPLLQGCGAMYLKPESQVVALLFQIFEIIIIITAEKYIYAKKACTKK